MAHFSRPSAATTTITYGRGRFSGQLDLRHMRIPSLFGTRRIPRMFRCRQPQFSLGQPGPANPDSRQRKTSQLPAPHRRE
ncbi:hypothetical protein E4U53_004387 [Claviceps sorghi]|nr:hypothetical protein E4U53_004387 [Claviceps sorghi]